jgi:hypothetical protein
MNEEELKKIKKLLLHLDHKMEQMLQKIDRIMEKIGLDTNTEDSAPKPEAEDTSGWRVIQVDGDPQVISWDLRDFEP